MSTGCLSVQQIRFESFIRYGSTWRSNANEIPLKRLGTLYYQAIFSLALRFYSLILGDEMAFQFLLRHWHDKVTKESYTLTIGEGFWGTNMLAETLLYHLREYIVLVKWLYQETNFCVFLEVNMTFFTKFFNKNSNITVFQVIYYVNSL